MDPDGQLLWATDGVPICVAPGAIQRYGSIALDRDNCAIVAWEDSRGHKGSIFAQRVDCEGNLSWMAQGMPICLAPYEQLAPKTIPVSDDGAIVVWSDRRSGRGYYDLYALRIDQYGRNLWPFNGVCIFAGVNISYAQWGAVPDRNDGAIVVWQRRNWAPDPYDICAQRVDANGVCLWRSNGVVVCGAEGEQWNPLAASLSDGSVVIAWQDKRNGSKDIYAQKVSPGGVALWDPDGVCVSCGPGNKESLCIAASGGDEAIVAWADCRNGNFDIYAQKLNCDGKLLWAPEGAALCTEPAGQALAGLVRSADGGAIAAWYDKRFMGNSVFAQKVDADGAVLWGSNGIAVCSAEETGASCYSIRAAGDFEGGAIFAWEDYRATIKDSIQEPDIYAMRMVGISASVTRVDPLESPLRLRQNYPNPFNPATEITFELEEPASISLGIYDASGRLLRLLAHGRRAAGVHMERWDGLDMSGRAVASGIYFCRLEAGSFTETKKMVLLR